MHQAHFTGFSVLNGTVVNNFFFFTEENVLLSRAWLDNTVKHGFIVAFKIKNCGFIFTLNQNFSLAAHFQSENGITKIYFLKFQQIFFWRFINFEKTIIKAQIQQIFWNLKWKHYVWIFERYTSVLTFEIFMED
jgi:hypothetical protein